MSDTQELHNVDVDVNENIEVEETMESIQEEVVEGSSFSITADDINLSEDLEAMFRGDELTEDFKQKATTIFEAAVVTKVNEKVELIEAQFETKLFEQAEILTEELSQKMSSYLDYVVEDWMEENKLAVEKGIRAEVAESFLTGLKGLFEEHYVDIPEEEANVVEEMIERVEELEESLNSEIAKNVQLSESVEEFKKGVLIEKATEGLTESEKEKFKGLAESVKFLDEESFCTKLDYIKESYFSDEEESISQYEFDDAEPLTEEAREKPLEGTMSAYVNAISRSIKK